MSKKLFFAKVLFLFFFLLALNPLEAQTASPGNDKSKTVVYMLNERQTISAQQAIEIDKTLASKTGIFSSSTNAQAHTITVKVQDTFPEKNIKELLASVFKLEVKSYKTTDTTK
jgi:hypothetical protein